MIQIAIFIIVLEFFRGPWKGVVLQIEEAMKLENQKIISDFMSFYDEESDILGTTVLGFGAKQQEVTANEKLLALKKSYEDPQTNILQTILQEEEQEIDEKQ